MTTKITEKNISSLANAGVNWQSVVVADGSTGFTAVAGRGYFIDTTSGTITVTFPASPTAGDTIVINDYASTFATNNVIINFNGNKLEADTTNAILSTNDQTHTFVFTDSTQGWKIVNQDTGSNIQPSFISATGGTVTTDGNFKIHTFTGDGCFVVSSLGNPAGGGSNVDYLVIAGGGGGGYFYGGGGGAGGFRESKDSTLNSPHTASPLAATTGITVTATTFPITVGAGGLSKPGAPPYTIPTAVGTPGSNSVFSTITASGGGGGIGCDTNKRNGTPGGSGGGAGGAGSGGSGGSGNTPPTNPPQGNNGSSPGSPVSGGAGGGAGGNASGKVAGAGSYTSITGSPVVYAAGGNGGPPSPVTAPTADGRTAYDTSAAENTGSGAGADSGGPAPGVSKGGKGIVIIRYKFQ